ncbi:hypothetical protein OSB04_015998 [Centaurea solstitialis]|uniref:Uncharacterized protein n=1 Tax=Centaurea solstitialis TaxID=347529 RepID=A0AA38T073_9ASTR|nr:hypothetical protein OSB04_015998 [Centaurea solstitialis]
MPNYKPARTPVETDHKLSADGTPVHDPSLYRNLAGALQYLTFTRPDIGLAVQHVCLYMHDPREQHLQALKRILRCIRGTLAHGLQIHVSPSMNLTAYSDADWGGCPASRRSTFGYCVFLGDNIVSWSSKRQGVVSVSSAESEYRGVANTIAETSWIRNLLRELHRAPTKATIVYCDNISAINMSSNPVQHQRTKHIEIDIHFVRDKVTLGHVRVLHVPSSSQYADIFTKGLPHSLFSEFKSNLNICTSDVQTVGGNIRNGDNGFIANDHYRQYLKDIEIIQSLGVAAYRFSISWARLLPSKLSFFSLFKILLVVLGGRFGEVNPNGILFYNKILDNLLLRGIKPFVTIHHHDFPQELQDRYGSWLSPLMQYRDQGGSVGIVVDCLMYEPLTDDERDQEAVNRGLAFSIGWALDPLIFGDYPSEMRTYLGNQLPKFSYAERKFMADSIDYIAVNHYSTAYVKDCIHSSCGLTANRAIKGFVDVKSEMVFKSVSKICAIPSDYFSKEPFRNYRVERVQDGHYDAADSSKRHRRNGRLFKRYHNKPMFITENGYSEPKMQEVGVQDIQKDVKRIEFHKMYLSSLAQAIREGADVRGYFVWTLMDDFE